MDTDFSNEYIRNRVNKILTDNTKKPLLPLTAYHKQRRLKYLCRLITTGSAEPGAEVTFDVNTLKPLDFGKRRVGHPRKAWYITTLTELWQDVRSKDPTVRYSPTEPDYQDVRHITAIRNYAREVYNNSRK